MHLSTKVAWAKKGYSVFSKRGLNFEKGYVLVDNLKNILVYF